MKKLLPLLILGVAALLAYSWYKKKIDATYVSGLDAGTASILGF